jgi:membrane fusion protein, multidrug efflux system
MGIHLKSTRLIAWIKAHIRLSILAGLAMIYIGYELLSAIFVYSRDAYITTDLIGLAPEVSARVQTVLVRDNQSVRQGDVLIRLNPEVFELEVRRLQASLELARANVAKTKEAVDAAADQLAAKQATFDDAKANNERATELRTAGNLSQQAFDEAHSAYLVASANLAMARTAQVTARREIAVQTAAVAEMQAAVDRAQYDLDRTVLVAPVSGRIAPLSVRAGDYVNSGHAIIAIVSDQNWRLVVNLPERHLHGLKVGQPVWCYIGSDPWKIHPGKVRSIAPGVARSINSAGILPYVNLNTDWIRLARRFPVEIDLGDLPQRERLFLGSDASIFLVKRP